MSGIEVVYGGEILVKELQQASFELSSSNSDIITLNYNYKFKFKSIYSVSHIRDNSPASEVGIREGDFLVEINGKKAYNYKLGEIIEKFYGKNNKKVKLLIDRNGERLKFEFRLRKIL
jgi:C-terminal processing protease CtpA/Prc